MEVNKISIEVVYATPQKQTLLSFDVIAPCTAQSAIERSGIVQLHPEIDLTLHPIGLFGHKIKLSTLVNNHDRIEIYRPLIIDPKRARKLRI